MNLESPYVIVKISGTVTGDELSVRGVKMDGSNFSTPVPGNNQLKQQVKSRSKRASSAAT